MTNRVLRGGNFDENVADKRLSRRREDNPSYRELHVGIRPARAVEGKITRDR